MPLGLCSLLLTFNSEFSGKLLLSQYVKIESQAGEILIKKLF